jgi:hypothetical protein
MEENSCRVVRMDMSNKVSFQKVFAVCTLDILRVKDLRPE